MFNEFVQFFENLISNLTIFKLFVLLVILLLLLCQALILLAFLSGGNKK